MGVSRKRARRQIRTLMRLYGGCVICGRTGRKGLTRHHVIRQANGGPNALANLRPLCLGCHWLLHALEGLNGRVTQLAAVVLWLNSAAARPLAGSEHTVCGV
jgi:hypothetical protein